MKNVIVTVLILVFALSLRAQVIYVTPDGAGLKDGSSWINALDGNFPSGNGYTKMADAIRMASSGKQFWIAEGTYKACTDNDREKSFELGQNIRLFGGFQGVESDTNQRNIILHPTIFSGNIGLQNDSTDNTKIILKTISIPWTVYSYINGIDFLNSFNNLSNAIGTGIYNTALLSVKECDFKSNYTSGYGAGIKNERDVKIEKCLFYNNMAYSGGGLYNNFTSGLYPVPTATVISSKFSNNGSSAGGGGIRNCGVLTVTNSLIVNNSSITFANGGGIYGMSATGTPSVYTKIYNSTIANNSGANVVIWGGKGIVYNSIIWGNTTSLQNNPVVNIRYSIIQGFTGYPLVYNADPLFILPSSGTGPGFNGLIGNWNLRWCSPAFDLGADSLVPSGISTDIDGKPRIRYSAVDAGAYEFDTTGVIRNLIGFASNRIYISDSNSYYGSGSAWVSSVAGNAESCKYQGQSLLYEAMKDAASGTEIWIKKGIYKTSLNGNRNHSFTLANGVKVYGGFEGNENSVSERGNGITVFSGEIGVQSITTDNAYHIFNINQQGIGYSDTATLNRVVISSGYANGTTLASQGGGMIIGTGTKLKISNTAILGNTAGGNGGAVFIQPYSLVKIDSSSITDNSQIVTYSSSGFGNSAAGCGIFSQGKLIIQNSQVSRNANSSEGSGIYNTDSLFITNCHIDSNVTITYYAKAGGISNSKFCSITGSTVNYNDTKLRAGSLWNKAGATMIINGSDVSHNAVLNTGNGFGGGIVNEGTMTLANSSISNNSSPLDGGGIYNSINSQCHISDCIIAYNTSSGGWSATGGGGIFNKGVLEIERSAISNNLTQWYGGGIYNPTVVKSCLIVNNTNGASAGGLWIGAGCQGIFNSTVMNNMGVGVSSSTINGYNITILNPDTFLIKNSIIYGNDSQLSGHFNASNCCIEGTTLVNGNIYNDPELISPTTGKGPAYNGLMANWNLWACSPLVNTGDNTYITANDTLDANGNPRVKYSVVDMGATESQLSPQPGDCPAGNSDNVLWEIFKPKLATVQDEITVPWQSQIIYSLCTSYNNEPTTQTRIRGYIVPPSSGYYRFYLASDIGGKVFLSTDSAEFHKRLICSNNTSNHNWPLSLGNVDSIYLQCDKPYYFETFCQSSASGSGTAPMTYIKMGWVMPNSSQLQLITSEYLRRARSKQLFNVNYEIFKNKTSYNFNVLLGTDSIPDQVVKLDSLVTQDHSTSLDHFTSRIRGYLVPPVSGSYTFYFACDNVGQFWLSSDSSSTNAQLKSNITFVQTDWTQNTSTQNLTEGHKYFFEILHYDTVYTDLVKLGWKLPGGNIPVVIKTPYIMSSGDDISSDDFTILDKKIIAYPNWSITPRYLLAPWNSSSKTIRWTSSNNAVATIDPHGVIHTLSPGGCIITGMTEADSTLFDTAELTVTNYYGPYFVRPNALVSGGGHSWGDAINLQALLTILNQGQLQQQVKICVSEGTYKPTATPDRNYTFALRDVKIMGGFPAGNSGSDTTGRDISNHETILSGDIEVQGNSGDNSYHVVTATKTTEIDGFTIRDGRASCSSYSFALGGSTIVSDNDGGGVFIPRTRSNIILRNCIIRNNIAWNGGAGIFCDMASINVVQSSVLSLLNCSVHDNQIQQIYYNGGGIFTVQINGHGGGIYMNTSNLKVDNSVFFQNLSSYGYGKAIYLMGSPAAISNSSIYQNIGYYEDMWATSGSDYNLNNVTLIGKLVTSYSSSNVINSTIIGGGKTYGANSQVELDNSIWTGIDLSQFSDTSHVKVKYSILGNKLYGSSKNNIISNSVPASFTWLDSLANNGGLTPTMKLKNVPNNPAKTSGNHLYLGLTDQRGALRIDSVSIGAYQYDFPHTGIVEVKAFPEGLFNASTHSLTKSRNGFGEQFGGAIADKVSVELHQATAPFSLIGPALSANLLTTGYAQSLVTTPLPESLYIVVKHRNSIETWSSAPVTPVNGFVKYDFTQHINAAYGNNLKPIGSYFGIYSGDVNQDGVVDVLDMIAVDNLSAPGGNGYIPEDTNGDGVIDAADMGLIHGNSDLFIRKSLPE